ncbi:uncharacterized protein BDV14DRAFT_203274 [Aspergillus stella-maris]|uniref:uncharacterized protein n=1 Tax=Aspergillus stella-maris TaxID=1810926 RepID=UPI003CCD2F0D
MTGTPPTPNQSPPRATITLPNQYIPPHLYPHVHPENLRRHLQMQAEGSSQRPIAIIRGNIVHAQFSTRTPSTSTASSYTSADEGGNRTPTPPENRSSFGGRESHIVQGEPETGMGSEGKDSRNYLVDDDHDVDVHGNTRFDIVEGNGYTGGGGGISAHDDSTCLPGRPKSQAGYERVLRRQRLAQRDQERNLGYGQGYAGTYLSINPDTRQRLTLRKGRAWPSGYDSPGPYHQQRLPTASSIISPRTSASPSISEVLALRLQREQSPSPSPLPPSPPPPYPSLPLPAAAATAATVTVPDHNNNHPLYSYTSLHLAISTIWLMLIGALSLLVSATLLVSWYKGWVEPRYSSLWYLGIFCMAMVAYFMGAFMVLRVVRGGNYGGLNRMGRRVNR